MALNSRNSEGNAIPNLQPSISLPSKLFEVLHKPPVLDLENDLNTCSNCTESNNPCFNKVTEIKDRISELTELIDYVKNQIQVYPYDENELVLPPAVVNENTASVNSNRLTPPQDSCNSNGITRSGCVVREVDDNIFNVSAEYSLAHCVSVDFRMETGISVQFKDKFKRICELLDQRKTVGEVAFLKMEQRFVLYPIIKKFDDEKSNFGFVSSALTSLRHCCENLNIKKLAIPRINDMRQKLRWQNLTHILTEKFRDVDIEIIVYNHKEINENVNGLSIKEGQVKSFKIKEVLRPLVNIELAHEIAIILYGSVDGSVNKSCEKLNAKYEFATNYEDDCKKCSIGDVLPYPCRFGKVFIFIIRKSLSKPFMFQNLEQCISKFNKELKKVHYNNVAIEWDCNNEDVLFNEKIITVFRHKFSNTSIQLYVHNKKCEVVPYSRYCNTSKFEK